MVQQKIKVLHISSYISINKHPVFSRNISGYGYMVLDIVKSLSERENVSVDLLTLNSITQGEMYENVNILPRNWKNILRFSKFSDLREAVKFIHQNKLSLFWWIRVFYYYFALGHVRYIIEKEEYDLIHIHGITFSTYPIFNYFFNSKFKYLFTLHGLNSFNASIKKESAEFIIERDFLKKVIVQKINLTVVSSGIKRTILEAYSEKEINNLNVILNGVDIYPTKINTDINIRKKYKIPKNAKIGLCIGNISKNKNQLQVARVYSLINENIKENLYIFFLGKDNMGDFKGIINTYNSNGHLIFEGLIPKDDIFIYYSEADFTIVASEKEGFGLSIIEGFSYGLPCITFKDLDAIEDLYNENALFLVDSRDDNHFALAIEKFICKIWDQDKIKEFARNFSIEKMSEKYLKCYFNILNNR